ncbi:VanZ family protein [Curtobacterium sp. MCJR17_043]|uniref:VanZ family protein n=1 Tax=Curtobacterium sp. MCJR17_043 TaxID=2175660 RepID=UPI0024E0317A|nr:VanZ family protein [Curtobacterium sp. MCJR17_043]WIB36885.1 VanZ family protein [Curtobacterium sp. MCJR17_043]
MLRKLLLLALTAGYAWVIWRMTLTPHVFTEAENSFVLRAVAWVQQLPHGAWFTYDRTEFLANVAMFVPVGLIAALWLPRRWWVLGAVVAVALSVGIEFAQAVYLPYRVADPPRRAVERHGWSARCDVRRLRPEPAAGAPTAPSPAGPDRLTAARRAGRALVCSFGCRRTAADQERSHSRCGHRATDTLSRRAGKGILHGT